MDEMLEAIQVDVTEDPPTAKVEAFFKLLKASLAAYNAQMQSFMAVRNKNTFIVFITFSDMYVC
jgi:hypothetical protein